MEHDQRRHELHDLIHGRGSERRPFHDRRPRSGAHSDTAVALAEESASTLSDSGDDDGFRTAMHVLGWLTFTAGESEGARALT